MSRSEFRYNKKRKHYAYIYKDIGTYRKNILISSKQYVFNRKGKIKYVNISLYRHPNKHKKGKYYAIPRNYVDFNECFSDKNYSWDWDKNDKRKIKRIKKYKKK